MKYKLVKEKTAETILPSPGLHTWAYSPGSLMRGQAGPNPGKTFPLLSLPNNPILHPPPMSITLKEGFLSTLPEVC